MSKVMYWIDGSVDRKKCDNHMAEFLIYEDNDRLIYDEYKQAIIKNNDPSWKIISLVDFDVQYKNGEEGVLFP